MKVKYIRWSTIQQTPSRQLLDTDGYDMVIKEQCGGTIPFAERNEAKKLLMLIREGEVKELHIEELTRLGRNANDIVNTLQYCEDNSVNVVILNMQLHSVVNDKPNSIFKIVTYLLSAMASHEKEAIKERTEAGKIAARLKGVKFGRKMGTNESIKKFLDKPTNKKIAKLLNQNAHTIEQISKITDSSKTTVMKVKKALPAQ